MNQNHAHHQTKRLKTDMARQSSFNTTFRGATTGANFRSLTTVEGSADSPFKKKALVLSLNQTLIATETAKPKYPHTGVLIEFDGYESEIFVARRPGLKEFLMRLQRYYDIHIFTTNTCRYANTMLQVLNLRQFITSVFDRQDCKVIPGPLLLKNIEKVGELPENFVMIDDSLIQTSHYKENSIKISSFNGDETDTELLDLIPFLEKLAFVSEVRPVTEKLVVFNEGGDITKKPNSETIIGPEQDKPFGNLIRKLLGPLLPKSSSENLNASQQTQRNRAVTEVYPKQRPSINRGSIRNQQNTFKDFSLGSKIKNRFDKLPNLRESVVSTGVTEQCVEENMHGLPTPDFWKKSVVEEEDEFDYSILMSEVSESQRGRNSMRSSLQMRTHTRRVFNL